MEEQRQKISAWLGTGSINLFGIPFAGKDTQARLLADALGAAIIGGGDILRSHHDPTEVERIMNNGGLVPSDFFFQLIVPYLSRPDLKKKPLILDAIGRSHGEEDTVMSACERAGHPIKAVVSLTLSEKEVWHRFEISQQSQDRKKRADDREDVVKNRLRKFREKTLPVLGYYRQKNLLVEVDGEQSREKVLQDIFDALGQLAK